MGDPVHFTDANGEYVENPDILSYAIQIDVNSHNEFVRRISCFTQRISKSVEIDQE